jgi:hypothetical protein
MQKRFHCRFRAADSIGDLSDRKVIAVPKNRDYALCAGKLLQSPPSVNVKVDSRFLCDVAGNSDKSPRTTPDRSAR